MTKRRFVIVVEAADDAPPGSPPAAERVRRAARGLPSLFLTVLATAELTPADVDGDAGRPDPNARG